MRKLEIVICVDNTPDDEVKEFEKDPDLFEYYCSCSHMIYFLKEKEVSRL